jgi:hypothetical protein
MIGAYSGLDACGSLGKVAATSLSVRSGPGTTFASTDVLARDATVFVCADSRDGRWFGVVYSSSPAIDCGVTSPVSQPQAYTGACRSGWVRAKWVAIVAG